MIPSKPSPSWKTKLATTIESISHNPGHPLQVALRTYSLCLSLSLGPILLPLIFAPPHHPKRFTARAIALWRALLVELRPDGFAWAMATAVGGGVALQRLWDIMESRCIPLRTRLSQYQQTFLANAITSTLAIILLRWKGRGRSGKVSQTLDLTLLFLVRALDALVQASLLRKARKIVVRQVQTLSRDDMPLPHSTSPDTAVLDKQCEGPAKEWKRRFTMHLDALVFWVSSARIMWCFFYEPQRLPSSYGKWITSLARVDKRLLEVLRAVREGKWSYIHSLSSDRDILGSLAKELGRPPSWGDPTLLPAYGGNVADETWKQLGVAGRNGVGGLPCELVHGGLGARFGLHNSCTANAAIRAVYAFVQALVIYLPVHFLPTLLTKPSSIMRLHLAFPELLSSIRSAMFLSAYLSSYWFAVCFTRTLVLARLFPRISHDFWDSPYGCTLAGSLVCGTSIWIESARRRGEIALYVLPKALRALISEKWLRSGHPVVQFAECTTFVLSLASLLTHSVHQPESLRGLSRWTLAFIMKGPNAGPWKQHREENVAPTPKIGANLSLHEDR